MAMGLDQLMVMRKSLWVKVDLVVVVVIVDVEVEKEEFGGWCGSIW